MFPLSILRTGSRHAIRPRWFRIAFASGLADVEPRAVTVHQGHGGGEVVSAA